MGDRFYMQQKAAGYDKPKRLLKKDYLEELQDILRTEISGLDKCTIDTIKQLINATVARIQT